MHTRSDSFSQQLTPVNCTVLDTLVLDYLAQEGLIEATEATDDEDVSAALMAASAAYQQLHMGSISSAVAIVLIHCPEVLQDQRLTFKLKRQQFIELLRQSTAAGDAAALACAREELAPLALDAYPEAYLDFKKALLMLVQPQVHQHMQPGHPQQQQRGAQQQQDWSLEARYKLAEVLYHTMLQHISHTGPQLSQQLVYLLHLFTLYTSGSHGSSRGVSSTTQMQQLLATPEASLVEGLLLEGRDEGPLPPDISGQGYAERDVQALMAAVSISRLAAVDALKAAAGDASLALKRELLKFRLNKQQLDLLAWEYAAARNLLEPLDVPAAVPKAMEVDTDGEAAAVVAGSSKPGKRSKAALGTVSPLTNSSPFQTAAAAAASAEGQDVGTADLAGCIAAAGEARCAAAAAASSGTAAAAAAAAVDGALLRSDSQSPPYKVPRWRSKQTPSRFCGRKPAAAAGGGGGGASQGFDFRAEQVFVVSREINTQQQQQNVDPRRSLLHWQQQQHSDLQGHADNVVQQLHDQQRQQRWHQLQQQLKSQASTSDVLARQLEVQQSLQKLQILVEQGQYAEVEQMVENLQPGLLQDYPVVKFDIKRLQFTKLIQDGDLPTALQLARSQLTPLADKHPELLPSLKASMALLLPGHGGGSSNASDLASDNSAFLASLIPLLQTKLGVEPPNLQKLFRVLLTAHKGWFRVQRCQDPFATTLGLDKLAQPEGSAGFSGHRMSSLGFSSEQQQGLGQQQQGLGPDEGGFSGVGGRGGSRPGSAAAAAFAAAARQALLEDPLDLNGGVVMDVSEDGGPEFSEAAVLQVMEVLELPRAAALELLAQHDGDAEAAIMQVFG